MAEPAPTIHDPTPGEPPRRRRWIPVSLRMFLAILGILGAVAAWEGVRVYREQVAIRKIEREGGRVETRPRGPAWLRSWVGEGRMSILDDPIEVDLANMPISDALLGDVSRLTSLEKLNLDGTQITNAGLVHLRRLANLQEVSLILTPTTPDAVRTLKMSLPKCEKIYHLTSLKTVNPALVGVISTSRGLADEPKKDQTVRDAIAANAKMIEFRVGDVPIQLLRISAGEFEIGSPADEEGHDRHEEPVRKIKISKPFYFGKYEITQAQYRAVTGENPSDSEGDSLAVDQLTCPMAVAYCEKLSERVGVKVTLPTEAQWEYACRAGTRTRFHSGDREEDLEKVGWYLGNSGGKPHPVGQKAPNAFGLYDMHGNVGEICADFIQGYKDMDLSDPKGEVNQFENAQRGGSYALRSQFCRSAERSKNFHLFGDGGLRIAINVE